MCVCVYNVHSIHTIFLGLSSLGGRASRRSTSSSPSGTSIGPRGCPIFWLWDFYGGTPSYIYPKRWGWSAKIPSRNPEMDDFYRGTPMTMELGVCLKDWGKESINLLGMDFGNVFFASTVVIWGHVPFIDTPVWLFACK